MSTRDLFILALSEERRGGRTACGCDSSSAISRSCKWRFLYARDEGIINGVINKCPLITSRARARAHDESGCCYSSPGSARPPAHSIATTCTGCTGLYIPHPARVDDFSGPFPETLRDAQSVCPSGWRIAACAREIRFPHLGEQSLQMERRIRPEPAPF